MSKFTSLSLAVLVAAASSVPARADDAAPRTRAQVIAELDAARASGELQAMVGEDSGSFWLARQHRPSALTRDQARVGIVATPGQGHCATMFGEDSGSMCLASLPFEGQRTRAQALAEVHESRARGELHAQVGEDSGSMARSVPQQATSPLYAGR